MTCLITEHLDIWTNSREPKKTGGRGRGKKTNGYSLYGIKKLRELILELAVRGKLVPQDPNDEPASELLKKIAQEKARLIKAGKIKKQKKLPEITEDEKPFELPAGWEWARLGSISQINPRNEAEVNLKASFIPMPLISISHTGEHGQETKAWGEIKKGYTHFADGDIGVAKITPCFENSKAVVLSGLKNGIGAGTTELHIARPFGSTLVSRYVLLFLKAPMFLHAGETKMTGTAGQKRVPKEFFSETPLPLPPLAEQSRIVAKVDELMALCDQLEKQQTDSNTTHQTLLETLLATLTNAVDHDEFTHAWQRLANHFDLLFTTEQSIDQLKQTILQLAVMGKLVPQNPDDEPASVLLEKIAEEKDRLIKEGKIKKQKKLPEITEEEKPFDLPVGWEWVRLGTALKKITDGTHHSPPNYEHGEFLYISAKNIKYKGISLEDVSYVTREIHNEIFSRCNPEFGDILYIKDGATTGVATINNLKDPFSMLSSVALLKLPKGVFNSYLLLALISPFFYDSIRSDMTGVAITRVTLNKLNSAFIPLPPLAEQHRIVSKVDELMALCDTFKSCLTDAQATQKQLVNTVVNQVVG